MRSQGEGRLMQRRQVLKWGAASAALLAGGGYMLIPPAPPAVPRDVRVITTDIVASLTPAQAEKVIYPYDHAFRQYHNRGVWTDGLRIGLQNFSRQQLGLINELFHAGLSPRGREVLANQFFINYPGVLLIDLMILGDPRTDQYQVMLSGPHLNLRLGGRSVEGVAFGGPQVYGDQRGNHEPGLPGNVYQGQLDAGTELWHLLSGKQQDVALNETSPIQTQIELQGDSGVFAGVFVASLPTAAQAKVEDTINMILAQYPADDVDYAWQCMNANGGIERMHLSYYRDSEGDGGSCQYQTYRIEGPASVFYYRGYPHLHAFFNVAMDGNAPLSVGEEVTRLEGALNGVVQEAGLKQMFEASLAAMNDVDFGFYNADSVVGKLRAGTVRTGDIYNAESWQNRITRVAVKGQNITGELREQLEASGAAIAADRTYVVATTNHVAEDIPEIAFADVLEMETGGYLRDEVISHLKNQASLI